MTESLAIVCTNRRVQRFTKGACFPACTNFYDGRLTCPKEFPRKLNAGKWSLPIPKLGATLSINDLVSYWRSNNSNRFSPNALGNKSHRTVQLAAHRGRRRSIARGSDQQTSDRLPADDRLRTDDTDAVDM